MPASLPPDLRLTTARLVLRPPREGDLDDVVRGIGDFEVSRMLARVPYPYDAGDGRRWLALAHAKLAEGSELPLVIEADGAVVGGLGIHGIASRDTGAGSDFGYWLARPYWGKGYATEAAREALRFAFTTLGFARIVSGVLFDNPASFRVQEKLGFERTGTRLIHCIARRQEVEHIDTALSRERFMGFAA